MKYFIIILLMAMLFLPLVTEAQEVSGVTKVGSGWVAGQLIYYDATNKHSWLDAYGRNVVKFHEDWVTTLLDSGGATVGAPVETVDSLQINGWIETVVTAGAGLSTVRVSDTTGGAIYIHPATNDNDGYQMQLDGESFSADSSNALPTYFGISITTSQIVTQCDMLFGLTVTDGSAIVGVNDGIYFTTADGSATMSGVTELNTSATTTSVITTLAVATTYQLEFFFTGSRVEFYVDGTLQATHTAGIPANAGTKLLTPTIAYLNGASVATQGDSEHGVTVNWVSVIQVIN